ncbi:MAG: ComEA family DNA-binding protein [Cyanobacteria bacterium]|jgi:DNA uptake protein ComE-like DNA-binding protein|nr:ComEA family DNA-binding protein [Cyanobacteria bacterium GSL.Bin1]
MISLNPRFLWLRSKIKNDPYYRFQSLEEIAIAAQLNIKIEVNSAMVDDWLRLPGFSIRQAQTLTALTASGVQFYAIEDLAAALNLPVQRLQPFAPILSFTFADPESLLTPTRVNINMATAEELATLPFFDQALAEKVVVNRLNHGSYRNVADFHQRLGLEAQLTSQLMHYLRF